MDWALSWPWLALALLGAYHGLNPGMGWLFAVARGLQEGRRSAVLSSLVPILIGHEASVVVVVGVAVATEQLLAPPTVRLLAALVLVSVGVYRFSRPRSHPRGFGMRVGTVGLAAWSFLMASAHGAGLMVVPVLLGWPVVEALPAASQMATLVLLSTTVHVAAMLLVMASAALVVYQVVGLRILRRSWFNLDLVWAASLAMAGLITMFS
jgi:hypothetical protein